MNETTLKGSKLKTKVFYEWAIETQDEHGDIVDVNFADKLKDFKPYELESRYDIALYRNTYGIEGAETWEHADLKDREYFYPNNQPDLEKMTKRHQAEYKRFMRLF